MTQHVLALEPALSQDSLSTFPSFFPVLGASVLLHRRDSLWQSTKIYANDKGSTYDAGYLLKVS
jgi:hypothetical protein